MAELRSLLFWDVMQCVLVVVTTTNIHCVTFQNSKDVMVEINHQKTVLK
jgi:hypothetical protein